MRVVVTGAGGFIGKNLRVPLAQRRDLEVVPITRGCAEADLEQAIRTADVLIHLAGINRPKDPIEFTTGNIDLTRRVIDTLQQTDRKIPVAFASSVQTGRETPYGLTKRAAEEALFAHGEKHQCPVRVYRLPNVFGKWCRPNYNSVVATFCHNLARGLPIEIHDPSAELSLVYIDDVVCELIRFIDCKDVVSGFGEVRPVYTITVGRLAEQIAAFREVRSTLITERVGEGLLRALYATYVSYFRPSQFSYRVPKYDDSRGTYVEMLKTKDSGQFSFFTAAAGITRGGHFHHTKTEKFLVLKGNARFRFRDILTDESFELLANGDEPTIVETIPGWAHDITNIGKDELVVMLWANENFDKQRPDTHSHRV